MSAEIFKMMRAELAEAGEVHKIEFGTVSLSAYRNGSNGVTIHAGSTCEVKGETIAECADLLAARLSLSQETRAKELLDRAAELTEEARKIMEEV